MSMSKVHCEKVLDRAHLMGMDAGRRVGVNPMVVGTPTVTMPGIFMRSRIAAGAYKQMNISSPPIAKNVNDYVNIAIDLANDKKKNIELKETLKHAAKIHLFNDLKAVKEFEEFFKVTCNSP